MIIWLDAKIPPSLATFIRGNFRVNCLHVRDLGMSMLSDQEIFQRAREANAIIMSKDADFSILLMRHGPLPRIIWLTIGNTTNSNLREIMKQKLGIALELLSSGEAIVEITQK